MPSAVSTGHSLAQSFAAAAGVVGRVLGGESLNPALAELRRGAVAPALAAAAQDLCYNALRGYGVVDAALERLLDKPLADVPLHGLLLAAIAELLGRPQSAHAIVHQAVEAATLLDRPRAKSLVNAVLRNFQRNQSALLAEIEAGDRGRYRHPQWWIDALRAAYPGQWEGVHAHVGNQLWIFIKGGLWSSRTRSTAPTKPQFGPDGTVGWMPAVDISQGHESGNVGTTARDVVWITLKR